MANRRRRVPSVGDFPRFLRGHNFHGQFPPGALFLCGGLFEQAAAVRTDGYNAVVVNHDNLADMLLNLGSRRGPEQVLGLLSLAGRQRAERWPWLVSAGWSLFFTAGRRHGDSSTEVLPSIIPGSGIHQTPSRSCGKEKREHRTRIASPAQKQNKKSALLKAGGAMPSRTRPTGPTTPGRPWSARPERGFFIVSQTA